MARRITVTVANDTDQMLEAAAAAEGVSKSRYIVEAAILRAGWTFAGGTPPEEVFRLHAEVQKLKEELARLQERRRRGQASG